ncbi:MAG: hypothetical protein DHS20C21_19700 [Gemmatimonadota bacterium]|nr:MAG: hypothetical protein DHS20C21_19700 [Gemmatimonadota bacterium]
MSFRVVMVVLLLGFAGAHAQGGAALPSGDAFSVRLGRAMEAGPVAWDGLWDPNARDETQRMLDVRSQALFQWSNVQVVSEGEWDLGSDRVAQDLTVRGTATWRPNAWGVASSFWTPQWDEHFESNRVVRRERWIRKRGSGEMVAREPLSSLSVVEAQIDLGVYPGQSAILVDATYYVRALADGVQHVRFLLDRRSHIYDLRVNGQLAPLVRGNELGSLGLEGFSPELESSFELPRPLAKGEEALVKFRLRSPIVHLQDNGQVTSLPLADGPFRERVWIPLLGSVGGDGSGNLTNVKLSVRWPHGAFESVAVAAKPLDGLVDEPNDEKLEERRILLTSRSDLRDLDFALFEEGSSLSDLSTPVRVGMERRPGVFWFERTDGPAESRTRMALVDPLLDAAQSSSRDLSSELQELIPLDADMVDELFDDSSTDAERSADDRSAG